MHNKNVEQCCNQIQIPSKIAAAESPVAYAGFIFGLKYRYTYLLRIIFERCFKKSRDTGKEYQIALHKIFVKWLPME